MLEWLVWVGLALAAFVVLSLGMAAVFRSFYRKVDQGRALIVNTLRTEPRVTFTGTIVWPVIHRAELMDISLKRIEIDRRGKEGLICQDNIRADIKVNFFVRVNKTRDDVMKVAQAIGCARASDPDTLETLFAAKFAEALKTVGKKIDFEDLYTRRDDFRDQIVDVIGRDLNGFILDDCAIDHLEQTPKDVLDESNILDAQGICKITEITTREKVRTNALENDERKRIKQQDVDAAQAILELERQRADAEAKQKREIAVAVARETAETNKVQAEETFRADEARLKAEEALSVQKENMQREVEVAAKNRERVVFVEVERVEKDRALEAVAREREVALSTIAKDKALEVERKEIQDVIRERVAVERTVAEEEERIKELRVVEEARRQKSTVVISAEAQAEEQLVKDIKAAEAAERVAAHASRERLVMAEAELEASDKEATAKIRLAEGTQATSAAEGLASARVKEAEAVANEKLGLADVRVREANADAIQKVGVAEATVVREHGRAQAEARAADLNAEATGLTEKARAMAELDEASRTHEEYRLQLEKEKAVELEALAMRKEVAVAQADVLGKSLASANIDIVGGESLFVDRVVQAMAMGKSVDGALDKSEALRALAGEYVEGQRSLPQDVVDVLKNPRLSVSDLQGLTVSALLTRLMAGASEDSKTKLAKLLDAATAAGLADTPLS